MSWVSRLLRKLGQRVPRHVEGYATSVVFGGAAELPHVVAAMQGLDEIVARAHAEAHRRAIAAQLAEQEMAAYRARRARRDAARPAAIIEVK